MEMEQKWGEKEKKLYYKLEESKSKVHQHLCNNFNTPDVLMELDTLINSTYVYLKETNSKFNLILSILNYVTHIFNCLGLNYNLHSDTNSTYDYSKLV